MKIATWNVNSVKARLPHLLAWLDDAKPDIALLQELKCTTDAFPYMEVEALGYHVAAHGEKTYNGVAILSKFPLTDIVTTLPGGDGDTHHRYIEAKVVHEGFPLRVASIYVPNGQTVDSDKYAYKLRFYARLQAYAAMLLAREEAVVLGGDYNVAPHDIDVRNVNAWKNSVLCHASARAGLRTLLNAGWYDAYRTLHPLSLSLPHEGGGMGGGEYTWWDYRANAFTADDGLRIDHLLLSPQAADRLIACNTHRSVRAQDKASDHAPVVAELRI